jgi:uncharacterized membrane protein YidH (DUF202 family)
MNYSETPVRPETTMDAVRSLVGVLLSTALAFGMFMFMGLMTGFASDSGPNPMYYFLLAYTISIIPVSLACSIIGLWRRSNKFLAAGFLYPLAGLVFILAIPLLLGVLIALSSLFS